MKYIKRCIKIVTAIIALLVITAYATDYNYILKGIRVVYLTGHTSAYIDDYTHFENMTIEAGNPQPWPIHRKYNAVNVSKSLLNSNTKTGTVAFLVIKNDSLLYENYAQNYSANSKTNSFSMAKSIVSAMLGKAIMDGHIKSLDQPLGDFFEQFKNSKTTVGDLSSMASGLDWTEHYTSPFSVTARAYFDDNLEQIMLQQKITETPGEKFKYLSGNTQLLGMVIEKATGQKMANYLSQSFWKPMGFENDGLWQVDDATHQLAKTYCCIASNARDFARFGKLYKNNGVWKGKQLLDSGFVAKSIRPRFEKDQEYGYGFWLSNYLNKKIFVMRGILGQYVITIPEDNLIIVRLGHSFGKKDNRPFHKAFYTYVDEALIMSHSTK